MRAFATLLDRLSFTASRNAKLVLVRDYLKAAPDPERGWALACLTGELTFDAAKPAMIRKAVEARIDPTLFRWSYDYVGDLAETVALVWPAKPGANREPELNEVVDELRAAHRSSTQKLIEGWLDALDADGRWALLKLLTGALRVGLSARLAKQAAADMAESYGVSVTVSDIEEVWHALDAPYAELFAWLEGRGPRPNPNAPGRFRPVMLAQAVDEQSDFPKLDPANYAAEWKWDGIRVQAVRERGADGEVVAKLYSRTGDEISGAFPDLMAALDFEGVIDGELLVLREHRVQPFGDLQQRLNRKAADRQDHGCAKFPAGIRAYDLLMDEAGRRFARASPFSRTPQAAGRLLSPGWASKRIDLSPLATLRTVGRKLTGAARQPAGWRSRQIAEGLDAEALGQRL